MFSAYTIKKILPRLLIAAVAIQLSWWLCTEAIRATNVIAAGVEGLIYAPFGGLTGRLNINSLLVSGGAASAGAAVTSYAVITASLAAAVYAGPVTVVGLLALAGTALLGALIALFLLVLRRLVILFLVLTAPIAIAAWILPGTQKIWKLWWESFTKLLLVYPMILGIIAVGKVAAYVASKSMNSFLGFFIVIICYFGPLFLIPALLKLSGAAFATITGAVNNRGKGAFDRLRNVRANESKKNWGNTKSGQRFKGSNRFTSGLNQIGAHAGAGFSGKFGLGKGGANYMDEFLMTNSDEFMKSQAWKGNMFKDDAMRALTYGNEGAAKAALAQRVASGKMSQDAMDSALIAAKRIGYGQTSQVAAARQMAMNKTGFDDAQDAMETIARASNGNSTLQSSLKENVKYISKGVGRHDLGALDSRLSGETDDAWNDRMTVAGAQTADAMTLARDHSKSMDNINASVRRLKGGGPERTSRPLTDAEKAAQQAAKEASKRAAVQTDATRAAEGLATAEGYATLQNQQGITEVAGLPTGAGETPVPDPSGSRTITRQEDGSWKDTPDTVLKEETIGDAARKKGTSIDRDIAADAMGRDAGGAAHGPGDE